MFRNRLRLRLRQKCFTTCFLFFYDYLGNQIKSVGFQFDKIIEILINLQRRINPNYVFLHE